MMRRKAREGIEQGAYYPEPHWISNSRRLAFWYRFLLGRPMDGQRWTDSTFWRSATRGEDHAWLRLAGWHRALIRTGVLYLLALLLPALLLLRAIGAGGVATQIIVLHIVLWSAVLLPVLTYRLIRARGLVLPWVNVSTDAQTLERSYALTRVTLLHGRAEWLRERVLPVARTAAPLLSRRYHPREAAQWVYVPRDYRDGGAVEILLPGSYAGQERAQRSFVKAVEVRLGMRDMRAEWQLGGSAPRVLLTAPALPPSFVSFEDMLPALQQTPEYTFVLGRAAGEWLSVSLQDDSPHLALSAGSGAGKSVLIRALVAQAMHWGWSVIVLDWKGESQEWAERLPGVRYVRKIGALHDMCVKIGEEVEHRTEHRSDADKAERRKVLIVSEEWGVTAPLLKEYWDEQRSLADAEERRMMPLKSPAASALMKLNFTGRSLGMCQLLVAQRFSARVTNGNADLRESFTTIFMSRWKAQTFKMLAPDIKPIPKKLTKPGQWLAVTGDEAVQFQATFWTEPEAASWATSGQQPGASPWSVAASPLRDTLSRTQGEQVATVATCHHAEVPAIEAQVLRKLVDLSLGLEYLGITHNMLKKAARTDSQGDPDFPPAEGGNQFSGYLYDEKKVHAWARGKRAAEAAEKGVK